MFILIKQFIKIFLILVYLNDNIIYHHILQDDKILGVVGMLERKNKIF